jgi:NADPH:quinone reductase-like Zn-dependent oxidoreductase
MRAITLESPDTAPRLRDDLPDPIPAGDHVVVRVHASSVNPVDNSIAAGMLASIGLEYDYPVILGRDYAGVVEHIGEAVSKYKTGDQVFGFLLHANPNVRDGAWAERITLTEEISIAPVRDGVDLVTAGAAPLAGITALVLVDALDLSSGGEACQAASALEAHLGFAEGAAQRPGPPGAPRPAALRSAPSAFASSDSASSSRVPVPSPHLHRGPGSARKR